jgi:spermidine synthase
MAETILGDHCVVPINISEQRGVRFLHFGSPWIQGAMRIARPWSLELEYTRDLMFPLLLRGGDDWPRSVLQVGLGAASITRFLHRHFPATKLTVVEIDPLVVVAAYQYFRLPGESAHLQVVEGDAADFLATKDRRFDLIVVDGYDGKGRAGMLDTESFYLNCLRRLTRDGMLSVNLLTRTRGVGASVERLRRSFDGRVLVLPPSEAGNTVAVAAAGSAIAANIPALRSAASRLRATTGLDLSSALSRIEEARSSDRIEL